MIVYTAIINDYDTLFEPRVRGNGVRYVCITDSPPSDPKGWEILPVEPTEAHPRLQQRSYKILSHRMFPDTEISLYIDGNFELLVDPRQLAERYLVNSDIALFRHPERDGIFAELEACAALGKDDPRTLAAVASRYRADGLPDVGYLYAGGLILRRHTAAIVEFNEAWHEELLRSTFRDQPPLGYTLWRTGITPATIDENIWHNDLFNYHVHPHKRTG
jgi:hypothetical protein